MEFGWQHTTYKKTAASVGRDAWLSRIAWGLCLLSLMGCSPQRNYESLLVLADIVAVDAPSRLKESTPPPVRKPVSFVMEGRARSGDLYLPGEGKPLAGIVLVPGAVPHGKDDARLVAFATTLAAPGSRC